MAIEANTLLDEAKCYMCYGPMSLAEMLEIALLRRRLLVLSPAADVTPNGLLDYSKCYGCLGASYFELFKLALLGKISES
jgi:streptomycin 6-kinase